MKAASNQLYNDFSIFHWQVATSPRANDKTISRIGASVIRVASIIDRDQARKDDQTISRASTTPHLRKFIIRASRETVINKDSRIKAVHHRLLHRTKITDRIKEATRQAVISSGRLNAEASRASEDISRVAAVISGSTPAMINSRNSATSARSQRRFLALQTHDMEAVTVAINCTT